MLGTIIRQRGASVKVATLLILGILACSCAGPNSVTKGNARDVLTAPECLTPREVQATSYVEVQASTPKLVESLATSRARALLLPMMVPIDFVIMRRGELSTFSAIEEGTIRSTMELRSLGKGLAATAYGTAPETPAMARGTLRQRIDADIPGELRVAVEAWDKKVAEAIRLATKGRKGYVRGSDLILENRWAPIEDGVRGALEVVLRIDEDRDLTPEEIAELTGGAGKLPAGALQKRPPELQQKVQDAFKESETSKGE